MNEKKAVEVGKFLSLVLRHSPETIDLELDENGWADITELIEKSAKKKVFFSNEDLLFIVKNNNKQRYALNDKMTHIRANQGHSISIDLQLKEIFPPEELYHGTATRFLPSIKEDGLVKQNRQFVHLSQDIDTAINVGKRHGKPIVLKILAQKMISDGCKFYKSENDVWLTDAVPVKYIVFEE